MRAGGRIVAALRGVVKKIDGVFAGASTWLKSAVRTGFPPGTQLHRLDITGGLATVDLTAHGLGPADPKVADAVRGAFAFGDPALLDAHLRDTFVR